MAASVAVGRDERERGRTDRLGPAFCRSASAVSPPCGSRLARWRIGCVGPVPSRDEVLTRNVVQDMNLATTNDSYCDRASFNGVALRK